MAAKLARFQSSRTAACRNTGEEFTDCFRPDGTLAFALVAAAGENVHNSRAGVLEVVNTELRAYYATDGKRLQVLRKLKANGQETPGFDTRKYAFMGMCGAGIYRLLPTLDAVDRYVAAERAKKAGRQPVTTFARGDLCEG